MVGRHNVVRNLLPGFSKPPGRRDNPYHFLAVLNGSEAALGEEDWILAASKFEKIVAERELHPDSFPETVSPANSTGITARKDLSIFLRWTALASARSCHPPVHTLPSAPAGTFQVVGHYLTNLYIEIQGFSHTLARDTIFKIRCAIQF
jgi:hypothetical protein